MPKISDPELRRFARELKRAFRGLSKREDASVANLS